MASLGFEPLDFEADREVAKMARASVRATNLHIKRMERTRARDARDWTFGKGIEGAKPHHSVRAAARTCLAKGVVESQEDMPSIVRMSPTETKGVRRKPAVARPVRGAKVHDDACEEVVHDSAPVIGEDEVGNAASSEGCDWQKLEREAAAAPTVEAARKKAGCVIS